ncbi:MAG: ATP-binding protein [Phycisphaerales bacterium]
MRFTVTSKLWLSLALLVAIGLFALVLTSRGLKRVEREIRHLAEVNEPAKSATHEMEINVNGIAIGTLGYLGVPDPRFRELISKDDADFERFHSQYLGVAATEQEREFGRLMRSLYDRFRDLGRELLDGRDEQEARYGALLATFEEMDGVIDNQLRPGLDPRRPGDAATLEALHSVEADLAEVGMWIADYHRSHSPRALDRVAANESECLATLGRLAEADLAGEKRQQAEGLGAAFRAAMDRVRRILAIEDELTGGSERLIALRGEIDALLDERMQPLAVEMLTRPRRDADAVIAAVTRQMLWLMPLFGAVVVLVWFALLRSVTRPLSALTRGTEIVSRGDLGHRVSAGGRDEFGDLSSKFNQMVDRLQRTLVSKERLEEVERALRQTVVALREEIAERAKAEDARSRLQQSLRRSETFSAIGALVVGVVHQARNPLFGISSTLDAMEARLGPREEYRRYVSVLREQGSRLSALMGELMEFARPRDIRSPGSLDRVIREAIASCAVIAREAGVSLVERIADPLPIVEMDRPRLARALESLIENAIQYSPAGGRVSIVAERAEREGAAGVACRVADGGPGIDDADLPLIFEPFFTRRPGGTGLGLAIVHRIVQGHGGTVTAANAPGGGALLTIWLPSPEGAGAREASATEGAEP